MASLCKRIFVIGACFSTFVLSKNIQTLTSSSQGDYYTSQHAIRKLARVEKEIAAAVEKYVGVLEKRLESAKKFLSDYETSGVHFNSTLSISNSEGGSRNVKISKNSGDMAYLVSAHPLRAYRLLRRFVKDLPTLERELRTDEERRFLKLTEKVKAKISFPSQRDMQGATEGLLRIHDTFNMNIADFTSGSFYGLSTNTSLNAADCLYIGLYALQATILTRAIEWLERAFFLSTVSNDKSVARTEIRKQLQLAISQHNEALLKGSKNPYLFTDLVFIKDALKEDIRLSRKRVLDATTTKYALRNTNSGLHDLTNFAALCSGKQLRSPLQVSQLKCWYENNHPLNILMPLKIESHSEEPLVLQFHQLISSTQIARILKAAHETMSRSQVHSSTSQNSKVVSASRTSTSTWLNESDPRSPLKDLRKVYQRIEAFTGLKIVDKEASEILQVSCYGIAGHFNPHLDTVFDSVDKNSLGQDEVKRGDRLATIMLYLSDVMRGGATAFPRLGVTVEPSKGSALFWYNMKPEGHPDQLSLHGGCPILYGNKCVSNKWIRDNSQLQQCIQQP